MSAALAADLAGPTLDLAVGAFAVVVGYAVGSVNPAAIVARVRRTDLRSIGSGNPGATNAARAFGWRVGVLVGVVDLLKGLLPVLLVDHLGAPVAALVAGLAAVVGHVTSPWLRGRGGKGVATSLGAILGVQPVWALPVLLVFGVVLRLTRRVGVASVAGAFVLVPAAVQWHDRPADVVFAVALAALVVVRHRRNLAEAASPR